MSGDYNVGANELKELAGELNDLLKIRTFPIGLKQFASVEEMEAVDGVRWPSEGRLHTTCQIVTQARIAGFTIAATAGNVRGGNCRGVMGFEKPDEPTLSGERMTGVWFENQEGAKAHQDGMIRQVYDTFVGTICSPLRSGRLDPPDIIMFYGTPGQIVLFVNGLQWKRYKRYDMTITGESACSDSWGRALRTRETSISIPCYAERRYGGVADDEMLIAMPPDEFVRGIEGLQALSKNGLRYPIPPYGAHMDPSEGMGRSYG
ncbi:MAG: DUF169 domain-containing protein [Pseudomonadota bacterium]|nr:DUF169 domain-containing protein [Pseudomonadota bacterium]